MITITIPGVPLPWKAPFVGSKGCWSPRYEISKKIRPIIQEQYKGDILEEALIVEIFFHMPIPKATSKKRRLLMLEGKIRPTTTPDRTNMAKYFEDLLQGIVIKNDSQIVDGRISKWYDENPRSVINIYVC